MKSQFHVLLMILPAEAPRYYHWDNWRKAFDILTDLVFAADKKPDMDFIQSSKNKAFKNPRRLLWNEKNMEKWTHFSPVTQSVGDDIDFLSMRLWAPSQSVFLETRKAPLLLIKLHRLCEPRDGIDTYGQFFMLAAQKNFIQENQVLYENTVRNIKLLMEPSIAAVVDSGWVYRQTEFKRMTLEYPLQFLRRDWDYSPKPASEIFDMNGAKYSLVEFARS